MPDWVDELGALEKELAPLAGKIQRVELLRKAIRERVPADPADKTFELAGERFVAYAGARGNRTVVDWPGLVRRIGAGRFATFATAPVELLKKHVAAGHLAACLTVEQSGPRSLKVVEKGGAR
jgi:hypothetical protein